MTTALPLQFKRAGKHAERKITSEQARKKSARIFSNQIRIYAPTTEKQTRRESSHDLFLPKALQLMNLRNQTN